MHCIATKLQKNKTRKVVHDPLNLVAVIPYQHPSRRQNVHSTASKSTNVQTLQPNASRFCRSIINKHQMNSLVNECTLHSHSCSVRYLVAHKLQRIRSVNFGYYPCNFFIVSHFSSMNKFLLPAQHKYTAYA